MEKQSINGGKLPALGKKLPKERVFGANTVQLLEDEANQLIKLLYFHTVFVVSTNIMLLLYMD